MAELEYALAVQLLEPKLTKDLSHKGLFLWQLERYGVNNIIKHLNKKIANNLELHNTRVMYSLQIELRGISSGFSFCSA